MNKYTFDLNGKEINLRLTSSDIIEIEKKSKTSILDVVKNVSFENIATLLRYMRKSSDITFSMNDAYSFLDELIDNNYDLVRIYSELILPTCQVSGVISEKDLNEIQEAITNQHN